METDRRAALAAAADALGLTPQGVRQQVRQLRIAVRDMGILG